MVLYLKMFIVSKPGQANRVSVKSSFNLSFFPVSLPTCYLPLNSSCSTRLEPLCSVMCFTISQDRWLASSATALYQLLGSACEFES